MRRSSPRRGTNSRLVDMLSSLGTNGIPILDQFRFPRAISSVKLGVSRNGGEDGDEYGEEMLFEFVVGFGVVGFRCGFGGRDGFIIRRVVLVVFVGVVVLLFFHGFVYLGYRFVTAGRVGKAVWDCGCCCLLMKVFS